MENKTLKKLFFKNFFVIYKNTFIFADVNITKNYYLNENHYIYILVATILTILIYRKEGPRCVYNFFNHTFKGAASILYDVSAFLIYIHTISFLKIYY